MTDKPVCSYCKKPVRKLDDFCPGCDHFICPECDKNEDVWGPHKVEDHQDV